MGKKKQPHYRIVVTDSRAPRDGRFVENLGYYNPVSHPARLKVDLERVDYWVGQGAIVSPTVGSLVSRARAGGDETVALAGAPADDDVRADAAAENGAAAQAAADAGDAAESAAAADAGDAAESAAATDDGNAADAPAAPEAADAETESTEAEETPAASEDGEPAAADSAADSA